MTFCVKMLNSHVRLASSNTIYWFFIFSCFIETQSLVQDYSSYWKMFMFPRFLDFWWWAVSLGGQLLGGESWLSGWLVLLLRHLAAFPSYELPLNLVCVPGFCIALLLLGLIEHCLKGRLLIALSDAFVTKMFYILFLLNTSVMWVTYIPMSLTCLGKGERKDIKESKHVRLSVFWTSDFSLLWQVV